MNYAIANNLVGFGSLFTSLRVRVKEIRDGNAFVITADLHDAGTHLVIDPSQLSFPENESVYQHRNGLVIF